MDGSLHTISTCKRRQPTSLWQKSHTTRFAGESACATSMDQLFAAPSGAGFSLPRLLPQAASAGSTFWGSDDIGPRL
jgi:hypothetical protein